MRVCACAAQCCEGGDGQGQRVVWKEARTRGGCVKSSCHEKSVESGKSKTLPRAIQAAGRFEGRGFSGGVGDHAPGKARASGQQPERDWSVAPVAVLPAPEPLRPWRPPRRRGSVGQRAGSRCRQGGWRKAFLKRLAPGPRLLHWPARSTAGQGGPCCCAPGGATSPCFASTAAPEPAGWPMPPVYRGNAANRR